MVHNPLTTQDSQKCPTIQVVSYFPICCAVAGDIELDRTWCIFDSDRLPVPGLSLSHVRPVTSVPAIHDSLVDFWTTRWQALSTIPENAWNRIFAFARAFMPRYVMQCPPITVEAVRAVFRSGPGLRTGGPDGWRKEDIVSLPDPFLEDAANLFAHVENGGSWPVQLTRGHVTCLQKKAGSHLVANYRPVVVFSLWYRLWGCLRARSFLAQLERIADFPAFGFLAGRGCKKSHLLSKLQWKRPWFMVNLAVELYLTLKNVSTACHVLLSSSWPPGWVWIQVLSMLGILFSV